MVANDLLLIDKRRGVDCKKIDHIKNTVKGLSNIGMKGWRMRTKIRYSRNGLMVLPNPPCYDFGA